MEQNESEKAVNEIYNYAAELMVNHKKGPEQTKGILVEQGLDEESAAVVVANVEDQIRAAKKERANKDMLYGALWCAGGTIATLADIGFIFWGAIVFGGIQFFKGLANA